MSGKKQLAKSSPRTPISLMNPNVEKRTRSSKSESEKQSLVVNSTFERTPSNRSILQSSLLKTGRSSPLATSLSESEGNASDDSTNTSKSKPRVIKSKCPCCRTSGGKSWLLTCKDCGQVWHSLCANLNGTELTQKGIDSLLPNWGCPWCFVAPFPRPKHHKSTKLANTLQTTCYANQISAEVIESLEGIVEQKMKHITQPTTDFIASIQHQLTELTQNIASLKNTPNHPPPPQMNEYNPPQPPKQPRRAPIQVENVSSINLDPKIKHMENQLEDYITEKEESDLMNMLQNQLVDFSTEGHRNVIQYGEHYKYMGSKSNPKEMPEPIKKLLDRLNNEYGSSHQEERYHYKLNSCLVNMYDDKESTLPEHADNEGDIDPKSSIFTISLGIPRHLQFRNLQSDETMTVKCNSRSMYQMTRYSQDFFKHTIRKEEDDSISDGIRFSLTFRAIHWSNFNSTILVGDSNFGPITFGSGKGKLGESTPGLRSWAPTIDSVDPLSCTSYRNVVLMVGTNDLKNKVTDQNVKELYKLYKTKVSLIRKYNPKCKIFICPVLPTKSHDKNRRIFMFNRFIVEDLCQCDLKVILVEGFIKFLDKRTNLLDYDLAKSDVGDELHLNRKGTSILVVLLKRCIFQFKSSKSKLSSSRLYSNALRGGPPNPV